jgi:hypothetical protein
MTKYKVIATFVFEDVEANSPEEAQALVDGTSFHSYIKHPKKDEIVNPSYEVEKITDENLRLAKAVMAWWKNHEFDTYQTEDDEYNVFDDEPEFITIARKIIDNEIRSANTK